MSMYGINAIPLEARYLYRRGMELSGQKNHEEAMKYLRQAIIIAPRFSRAYRELGTCLMCLGREEDAVYWSQKLSRIESNGTGTAGDFSGNLRNPCPGT
jgi:tetratricopeptide (TPR) repeat protein